MRLRDVSRPIRLVDAGQPKGVDLIDGSRPRELALLPRTGPAGPPGPPGAAGSGYNHTQASPSSTWVVNHNLGFRPDVSVTSLGGLEVEAEVSHMDDTTCTISFSLPFAGRARLS
jgi:hypothetical protein